MDASPSIHGAILVCIDMQPIFINAMPDAARVLNRCTFAIAAARGLRMPVAFTEQVPQKLGATEETLRALSLDSPVYAKNTFSALDDTAFGAALATHKAEHLLLCGLETSICIYQTAIGAIAAGYAVTILSDAVSARRPDDARTCLETLARAGAHILPSETVFYSLLRDVRHPFFKAYTQLVKSHG